MPGQQSIEDLEQEKRDVDAAVAENRRATQKARQQKKDAKKSEAKAWRLAPFLEHATLIIYTLTDYQIEPAIKFLGANSRKRHWPEKTEEELQALVEELFLAADLTELTALSDMVEPADVDAMKAALVYVQQWGLVDWTRRLNAQCGVAPSTESVLLRLEEKRLTIPEQVRPRAVGSACAVSARVWAGAWRKRWGGRHGRIRIRDDVSLPDLQRKVVRQYDHVLRKMLTFVYKMRSSFWAGKRHPFVGRNPASILDLGKYLNSCAIIIVISV
jgi:hypothetical protein